MSLHIEKLLACKKVLFLQGPMGGFFNRVSKWLQTKNIQTYKVNLNGGDKFFSRTSAYNKCIDYTDTLAKFSSWAEELIKTYDIDGVICFGDCRTYHKIVKALCQKQNIGFFVFEEGYIRPDYITFESDGVNANSNFKIDFDVENAHETEHECHKVNNHYWLMVCSSILYYTFMVMLYYRYSHYQHHRNLTTITELICWIKSGYRRCKNALFDPDSFNKLLSQYSKQYFVFPLQVHNDSQILVHTELKNMEEYIEIVIQDFSIHASKQHQLVLKHHPMDRGYRHYAKLIEKLANHYGCGGRVHYYCDVHLPTLLKYSLGVVTVNSTTGLQALYRDIPVKVLGQAIYNIQGLSYQESLSKFWLNLEQMDSSNYENFRRKLISDTQLNGAFYGKSFWMI